MRSMLAPIVVVLSCLVLFFWYGDAGDGRRVSLGRTLGAEQELRVQALETQPLGANVGAARSHAEGFVPEILMPASPAPVAGQKGFGRLRVRIDKDQDGQAQPYVRLVMQAVESVDGQRVRLLDLNKGEECVAVLTDSMGNASFELLAGVAWTLLAWDEHSGAGRREISIPALALGERRDVHIVWQRRGTFKIQSHLYDVLSGDPIGSAEVLLLSASEKLDQDTSSSDGNFQLWLDEGSHAYLKISAAGYTPAFLDAAKLMEQAVLGLDAAEAIGMLPLGSLGVRVPLHHGPAAPMGIEVLVDMEAWLGDLAHHIDLESDQIRLTAQLQGGEVLIEGVPSGAPLLARVRAPDKGASELVLVPAGGHAQVEFQIEPREFSWGKIRGVLTNLEGAPIAGQELWLVSAAKGSRYFECDERVRRSTISDESGGYSFEQLIPGAYLLGPCPDCPEKERKFKGPPRNPSEVVAMGTVVQAVGGKTVLLPLQLATQSYLRGRVLGQDSKPVLGATIELRTPGFGGRPPQGWDAENFVLGPLMPASLSLQARQAQQGQASDWVQAHAGEEPLELRLKPISGTVRGIVWDAFRNEPAACWVHLVPRGEPLFAKNYGWPRGGLGQRVRSQLGTGIFEFTGLEPGEYSLAAFLGARLVRASIPLILPLSSRNGFFSGVRLTLQPASHLRFMRPRNEWVTDGNAVEVWSQDSLWMRSPLSSFFRAVVDVPPGRLTCIRVDENSLGGRRTQLDAKPGETHDLTF